MKKCSSCTNYKSLIEFGKDKNKSDGFKLSCKKCRNEENKIRRDANPEKHRAINLAYARSETGKYKQWSNSLRRKFWPHLLPDEAVGEYNRLLDKQGHKCGLCKKPKEIFKMRLAVDHCHVTLAVRGLLCNICNRFEVGRHTLETAKALIAYLEGVTK